MFPFAVLKSYMLEECLITITFFLLFIAFVAYSCLVIHVATAKSDVFKICFTCTSKVKSGYFKEYDDVRYHLLLTGLPFKFHSKF